MHGPSWFQAGLPELHKILFCKRVMANSNNNNNNFNTPYRTDLKSLAAAVVNLGIQAPSLYMGPSCARGGTAALANNGARGRYVREMDVLARDVLAKYALRKIRGARKVSELNALMHAWTGNAQWTEGAHMRAVRNFKRKYTAQVKISRAYRHAMASPYSAMGKRRLRREFGELQANLNAHLKKRRTS